MGGGGGGARGAGAAVLLCAPAFTVSSPASAPVSALLRSSPSSSSAVYSSSLSSCCNPNSIRRGLLLSLPRGRRGRRFESARATKEDEGPDVNRDSAEPSKGGENGPVDWDKAWSSFKKPHKKKSFLTIDMEKYVSRQPKHSNYPMSEEVDPLRKSERSLLGAWTSMKFTYALVVVIVGLVVYMVIIVGPPPHH